MTPALIFAALVSACALGILGTWLATSHQRESLRAFERHCGIISTALREANRRADLAEAKLAKFGPKERDAAGHFMPVGKSQRAELN